MVSDRWNDPGVLRGAVSGADAFSLPAVGAAAGSVHGCGSFGHVGVHRGARRGLATPAPGGGTGRRPCPPGDRWRAELCVPDEEFTGVIQHDTDLPVMVMVVLEEPGAA